MTRKQHALFTKDEYDFVFLKGIYTSQARLNEASKKQQELGLWVSTRTVDVNTDDIDIAMTDIANRGVWERKGKHVITQKINM